MAKPDWKSKKKQHLHSLKKQLQQGIPAATRPSVETYSEKTKQATPTRTVRQTDNN